ncbi:MAG: DNA-directed RNA polymerase subunit omega [Deltaproteobacteria bacterium]|nr:DNA-directed RNA polymerase subunit omega [Deltaproteobacteria bacterium]
MSYLDLVEEYPKSFDMTLFEKIIMASKRAKDLHRGHEPLVHSPHKDTYVALEEINTDKITLEYRDDEPVENLIGRRDDSEDEE